MNIMDTSDTITLEEEIQEDYEPTDQDILEYAEHLGMDLAFDQQYLDIARAGLKAPLPEEWKPCQKIKNGQQDFFYKNMMTGEITYDHPGDLIFKKKYQDAKARDQKKPPGKKSGINKFKETIQQQRQTDVIEKQNHLLNDTNEDKSIMMESNAFQQQFISSVSELQDRVGGTLQQSSMMLQHQIDQEYQNQLQTYEQEKQKQYKELQEKNKEKLSKMEIMLLNQSDPNLSEIKSQYELKESQIMQENDQKKSKIKQKLQMDYQEKYEYQINQFKKKLDRDLEDEEDKQDKLIKSQLSSFQDGLSYSNVDLKKKIEMIKKQQDEKFGEQRRKVQKKFQHEKQNIKSQYIKAITEFEQHLKNELKKAKQAFKSQLTLQPKKDEYEQLISQYQTQLKSLKDQFKLQYDLNDAKQNYQLEINQYSDQMKEEMENNVQNYKNENKNLQDKQKQLREEKDNFNKNKQFEIKQHETQIKEKYDQQREQLHSKKAEKFNKLKGDGGNDREIQLYMEMSKIQSEIECSQDEIRKLKREKEQKEQKIKALNIVVIKYDLHREANSVELIKYDLEHKQFTVSKIQKEHDKIDQEFQEFQNKVTQLEEKAEQKNNLIQQQKMDALMQSVIQLKDMIQSQNVGQQQMQQSFVPQMQMTMQMQESMKPKTEENDKRKWQNKLARERVQLNRELEEAKSEKIKQQQLQQKLLKDQANLKQEIHSQSNISQMKQEMIKLIQIRKDLLKKMKSEVQNNLNRLSKSILTLNQKRTILKEKDQALKAIEKQLDENLESINQTYDMYRVIGKAQSHSKQESQDMQIIDQEFILDDKLDTKMQNKMEDQLEVSTPPQFKRVNQMDLIGQIDDIQNMKYKLISHDTPESRLNLQKYSQRLV